MGLVIKCLFPGSSLHAWTSSAICLIGQLRQGCHKENKKMLVYFIYLFVVPWNGVTLFNFENEKLITFVLSKKCLKTSYISVLPHHRIR